MLVSEKLLKDSLSANDLRLSRCLLSSPHGSV